MERCETCRATFSSREKWLCHCREQHRGDKVRCPLCPYEVPASQAYRLKDHVGRRHPTDRLRTPVRPLPSPTWSSPASRRGARPACGLCGTVPAVAGRDNSDGSGGGDSREGGDGSRGGDSREGGGDSSRGGDSREGGGDGSSRGGEDVACARPQK